MFGLGEAVVIGYDLSNEYAQISYMSKSDDMARTLSLTRDSEDYNIPACLFKRGEVNQWFVGREAINYSSMDEGEMVYSLWERALIGDNVSVGGEDFDPIALLALFVRRTLALLYSEVNRDSIKGIMFTVPSLTTRSIEVLEAVSLNLGLSDVKCAYQGREESIYYYCINQPVELWQRDVLVYEYDKGPMNAYHFHVNTNTRPNVALTTLKTYVPEEMGSNQDNAFLAIIKDSIGSSIVSSSYLLGDGFDGDWMKDSIGELCRGRRAFKGNNLYSRGAVYACREKVGLCGKNAKIIFLGKDKLIANVGMEVQSGDGVKYLALLDGGENWFDSKTTVDVILDKGNSFVLTITPLDGRNVRNVEIILDGLQEHEPKALRIRLELVMESETELRVNVTDLGFGDFLKATNQLFTQKIDLNPVKKDE